MLLREVRYGINVGFETVEIAPFRDSSRSRDHDQSFTYSVGNVKVEYDAPTRVSAVVPAGVSQHGPARKMAFRVSG